MGRKKTKMCLVCGKDFLGTEGAFTCGGSCRTMMSRLLANGKKPEFWLVAKNKGQKMPLVFSKPTPKKDKPNYPNIDFKPTTKDSYDAPPLEEIVTDKIGDIPKPLTLDQKEDIRKQIKKINEERCPSNKHPKMFILEQEMRVSELEEKLNAV